MLENLKKSIGSCFWWEDLRFPKQALIKLSLQGCASFSMSKLHILFLQMEIFCIFFNILSCNQYGLVLQTYAGWEIF